MTVHYLDASVWVKSYFREEGSAWLARFWKTGPVVGCSTLGLIEVIAAVVRRHRGSGVRPDITESLFGAVSRDFVGIYEVELDLPTARMAQAIARRHGLRGADCVHLASAFRLREIASQDVVVVASDAELLAAAAAEGMAVLDPRTNPPLPEPPR